MGHEFRAFSTLVAVMFFGRCVLHQAIEGHGSMETRYLTLTPRKHAHRFASRHRSCISQTWATPLVPIPKEPYETVPSPDAKIDHLGREELNSASTLDDEPLLPWEFVDDEE